MKANKLEYIESDDSMSFLETLPTKYQITILALALSLVSASLIFTLFLLFQNILVVIMTLLF